MFATIFVVELPDKTFIATLVLSTRYKPLPVWIGVSLAFLVQTVVAVTAGGLISRLPKTPVHVVVLILFLVAGILLIRSASHADEEEHEAEEEFTAKASKDARGLKAVSASFLVLFLAEWGDLSQLATAGFAAKQGQPVSVGIGAFAALALVSGLAAVLGRALLQRISLSMIRRAGGVICLILAALMALQLAGVETPLG
ncbi:TMEM165/GDT1 family protein [Metallococcus carri]|uniref:TMEM165/GDT1 family protein n=1 Tax=Metallococcus carri TaxID=1656884 RepID=UPI002E291B91|nr:TMEM165/GDT1 family protein [Metallococcus carri]